VGVGTFQYPEGHASYDGLQVNFKEQAAHPMGLSFVRQSSLEVSYAFSRLLATAGNNGISYGSDPFFTSPSYNNRNINGDFGWGGLDRTHILSFGGSATFKYGPQLSLIGHIESSRPTSLVIDDQGAAPGEIFRSDFNGDGQVGDLLPGSKPGAYMRQYGPRSLNTLIGTYNANYSGQPTPAGNDLISNGIFSSTQLAALGGVMPRLDPAPTVAFANTPLRTMDAVLRYPIRFKWMPESVNITPAASFYNVLNFANYGVVTGTVLTPGDNSADTGSVNSPFANGNDYAVKNSERTPRRTGTFDQGAPRETEFQLTINF
jgi:hypothetical protein